MIELLKIFRDGAILLFEGQEFFPLLFLNSLRYVSTPEGLAKFCPTHLMSRWLSCNNTIPPCSCGTFKLIGSKEDFFLIGARNELELLFQTPKPFICL
jgi:hypothetical protein